MSWVVRATSWVRSGRGIALDDPGIMAAHMAVFLAPELATAVVGGWLGARLGVVLIRHGWSRTEPGPARPERVP